MHLTIAWGPPKNALVHGTLRFIRRRWKLHPELRMKTSILLPAVCVGILALSRASDVAVAEQPDAKTAGGKPPATPTPATPAPAPATPAATKQPAALEYKVPAAFLKAPKVREQGGTRGSADALPALYVLAPDHVALTSRNQPMLFWYQSAPAAASFELALVEADQAKPLLSLKLEKAGGAGIRSISLARQNVSLEAGVEYRWNIALVPDPNNRSKDKVASGVIKRVPEPGDLKASAEKASPAERAALYARAGLWYDALQAISEAIAQNPGDASLHNLRASLLQQGGLPEAAKAERR
jgi:Domain of Unknown Function (DUF928)